MSKHHLNPDQIVEIAQHLQDGTEIPDHLLRLMNPSYFEKLFTDYNIDYQKLDKYKIPTIEYAGKRSEALILSQAGAMGGGSPLQIERCFNGKNQVENNSNNEDWKNLIVQGDNLQFLKTCYLNQDPLIKDKVKGKVKLIYIDPPFATKSDFGGKNGEASYADKIERAEFLEALRERLIFLREILADDGSIYVHLDQKMSHYVKVVMDEIFGKGIYRNEIAWHYQTGGIPQTFYAQKHDTILFYARGNYHFDPADLGVRRDQCDKCEQTLEKPNNMKKGVDENGRVFRSIISAGKEYRYFDDELVPPTDVWLNINQLQQKDPERTNASNYPTQKPEKLLYRIIEASTEIDDIILDCFAGSGTTAAVAEKLGRRWIACDFGKHAIYTMQKRLLEIGSSRKLGKDAKKDEKYGQDAKPFCVASVGAYDFQRIMNLRENKPAYIDFVLSLFGVSDRAKFEDGQYTDELEVKFKLANIYGQKDGNPVEVYPIWEDDYLKHIKIDEDYLGGIITQAGGRMRGKYYIIAPETCDLIGDTVIDDTEFIILSYPYKILEEMSRNFQMAEQPSSSQNINDLISSVRFYFNEEIEVGVERTDKGLKLTRLVTPILDKDGNHYQGFEALAMLLVDKDYDGTTFRMEEAIYAKDISEDGHCTITGLTDQIAVIAIDKHGNESKVVVLKKE